MDPANLTLATLTKTAGSMADLPGDLMPGGTARLSESRAPWRSPEYEGMPKNVRSSAQTPAHMSTLEAILARMTARPTEKDVAEVERLQKVMAGAD